MKTIIVVLGLLVLLGGLGAGGAAVLRRDTGAGPCAATVPPRGDIGKAVFDAPAGGTVSLAAGEHRPLSVARARADVTVRGAGADLTIIQAEGRDGVGITDVERFALADLSVRGGAGASIYISRARDVRLSGIRVDGAAIAVQVENSATVAIEDVTLDRSTDFGLLVRRMGSVTASSLRVNESRGIGIAAVDEPGSLTLRDSQVVRTVAGSGEGMVLNGWESFSLENVSISGGNPAGIYLARARTATLRNVQVEGALFGIHLDENANAELDDVSIVRSTGVGLLLQRGGAVTGRSVQVLDTNGTGVSSINGAGLLTLRDSEIGRVAAAGLFAGVAGCADLPAASLTVPECFYKDLEGQISTSRVLLERVNLYDTGGPCLVFFPGVQAQVRDSTLTRCELTGLFAWGAVADVSGSTFEDNAEHALEYRAFPDPRQTVIRTASGRIEDSVVRSTRALAGPILGDAGPGPVLGGGILAQGARLVIRRTEVSGNRDIGISFVNRSSGEVVENRITGNGNYAVCLLPDASVDVRDNTISGNRSDALTVCGGRPLAAP